MLKKRITGRTKAIMPVHYAGGVGNRKEVFELARGYNLRVIEDAAHAFGGYHDGQRIGQDGDIICFSFDGIKTITCGEGGAVLSKDITVIEKIRDLRLLGVVKDSDKRYAGQRSWDFNVEDQGWRYHMSNINASLGRSQLKKIDLFAQKRRSLAKVYMEELRDLPIQLFDFDIDNILPHIFPILVLNQRRDALKEFLAANSVETWMHYKPNHLLSRYKGTNCPNAERFWGEELTLPLHMALSENDIQKVISLIREFLKHS